MASTFGARYRIYALREVISRARIQLIHLDEQLNTKLCILRAHRQNQQRDSEEPPVKQRKVEDIEDIQDLQEEIRAIRRVHKTYQSYIRTKHAELMLLKKPHKKQERAPSMTEVLAR